MVLETCWRSAVAVSSAPLLRLKVPPPSTSVTTTMPLPWAPRAGRTNDVRPSSRAAGPALVMVGDDAVQDRRRDAGRLRQAFGDQLVVHARVVLARVERQDEGAVALVDAEDSAFVQGAGAREEPSHDSAAAGRRATVRRAGRRLSGEADRRIG